MGVYIGLTLIISLSAATLMTFFHEDGELTLTVKIGGILTMISVVGCWIICACSIGYGIIKLCKPNISQKIRRQVIIRHVVAIVFF